jgi:hypothetical protein
MPASYPIEYSQHTKTFNRQLPNILSTNKRDDILSTIYDCELLYNNSMYPFQSRTTKYAIIQYIGMLIAILCFTGMILFFAFGDNSQQAIGGIVMVCIAGIFLFAPTLYINREQGKAKERIKQEIGALLDEANQTKFENSNCKLYLDQDQKKIILNIVIQGYRSKDFTVPYDTKLALFGVDTLNIPTHRNLEPQQVSDIASRVTQVYNDILKPYISFYKIYIGMQIVGFTTIGISMFLTFTQEFVVSQTIMGVICIAMGTICTLMALYLIKRMGSLTMKNAYDAILPVLDHRNEELRPLGVQLVIKEGPEKDFITHPYIDVIIWNTTNDHQVSANDHETIVELDM